jgi:hypothetical protein
MRLIWCDWKSGIPCSTREYGYKRNGFGRFDVHVQLYTNILCMFWFLCKFESLKCILSRYNFLILKHILHFKPFHKEFLAFQLILFILLTAPIM